MTRLARHLGVPVPTAYRMLRALERAGYVEQLAESKEYRLTLKLFELGSRVASRTTLRDLAAVEVDRLRQQAGLASNVSVLVEGDVLYLSSAGSVSTTNEAKYRPAGSRITVTLAGAEGRSRDQRTSTSPIFGRRSRPLGRILNRAFAVNRIACLRSLRDLNRGRWILGPLRLPVTEAKKFR